MKAPIEIIAEVGRTLWRIRTEETEPEPRWSLYPLNTWTNQPEIVTFRRKAIHCTCRRPKGAEPCTHIRAIRYLVMNFGVPAQAWAHAPDEVPERCTPQDLADDAELRDDRRAFVSARLF